MKCCNNNSKIGMNLSKVIILIHSLERADFIACSIIIQKTENENYLEYKFISEQTKSKSKCYTVYLYRDLKKVYLQCKL